VNVGISVSRVGGAAQTKSMRQVAGRLKLDMASYRELAAFAQFGSDLDKSTQGQLNRGRRMQEVLKQPQYEPVSLEHQVIVIFAGTNGFADDVAVEKMRQWENDLKKYMDASHPGIGKDIAEKKVISPETEKKLRETLTAFKSSWQS
jgi:F-type H+-transporting ATPase subunit alpha